MYNTLYHEIEINLSNIPNSLTSEGNSELLLNSMKVSYPISLIVQSSNIKKKGNFLHDEVAEDTVYSILDNFLITIVLLFPFQSF